MPAHRSSLVLGTVQLGIPYGIANKTGQPDQATATEIIRTAWENKIREFDTAQDYGVSEKVLGNALRDLGISREAKVISKFDPKLDHLDAKALNTSLEKSLNLLKVPSLYAIMVHSEELLPLWNRGLGDIMRNIKLRGKVKKIGFSVYTPDRAIDALNTAGIDLVQVPTNILDRRFEHAGVFDKAKEKSKTIYIRSVFLQGLILINAEEIPGNMEFARPVLEKVNSLTKELGMTRQEIALGYLKEKVPDAKLVIGADTPEQVRENRECWERKPPANLISVVSRYFGQINEKILNPVEWSR